MAIFKVSKLQQNFIQHYFFINFADHLFLVFMEMEIKT